VTGVAAVTGPGGVALRPMRWWDIEPVLSLEAELFPDDPWTASGFWSELAGVPATRYYVVATDGQDVVGYAGLLAVQHEADVQTVGVRPDRQGSGLGAALVADLLAEADRRSCTQVLLEVRADNEPALRLYARFGFESISVRRDYYGPGADARVLRRRGVW